MGPSTARIILKAQVGIRTDRIQKSPIIHDVDLAENTFPKMYFE